MNHISDSITAKSEPSQVPLEQVHCALCGEETRTALWRSQNGFAIVRCLNCGLGYVNLRPPQSLIQQFYPANYYAHHSSSGVWAILGRIKQRLLMAVAIHKFGYPRPVGYSRGGVGQVVERLFAHLFAGRFTRIPPFQPTNAPRRSLDIGCGSGAYVSFLQELGWDACGIEPNPRAVQAARDRGCRNVSTGTIADLHSDGAGFDLVTLWDVLEHTHFPMRVLQQARDILRADGLLIVKVPNVECLEARIWKNDWMGFDAPIHLYDFTVQTLTAMLNKAGFRVRDLAYVTPPNMIASGLIVGLKWRLPLLDLAALFTPLTLLCVPIAFMLDVTHLGNTIQISAVPEGQDV